MPLPAPDVGRKPLHTRRIVCEGFQRDDGLWEVDGWITDVKAYSFENADRGTITAGEQLHGMGLRMTVDDDFVIRNIEAVTDFAPFRACPSITPNFKKLIGLKIVHGFTAKSRALMGGIEGCTHLVDLLGPIATTVLQTMTIRFRTQTKALRESGASVKPMLLNSCHSWSSDGAVVKREYPDYYTGK